MAEVTIIKANGQRVPFNEERLTSSVLRAGGTVADVAAVVQAVRPQVISGMTTSALYALVKQTLAKTNRCVSCRYSLRDALEKLGPSGFHFEHYVAALLAATGYVTELPEELQGSCVEHEVDVVAKKGTRAVAIECKFRNDSSDHVHLQDIMAAYARYIDLLDGAALNLCPRFDEFWVVTNGAFSDRAMKFGRCKGLRLIGWKYPDGAGLAKLIDRTKLYPITVLDGLTAPELNAFATARLMLCQDFTQHESSDLAHRTGLPQSRIEELAELASAVLATKVAVVA